MASRKKKVTKPREVASNRDPEVQAPPVDSEPAVEETRQAKSDPAATYPRGHANYHDKPEPRRGAADWEPGK